MPAIQNIAYHARNGHHFECDVIFTDEHIILERRVIDTTGTAKKADTHVFDRQSFAPISEESGHHAFEIIALPAGKGAFPRIPKDQPCFRHRCVKGDMPSADFTRENYMFSMRPLYDVLNLAIDQVTDGKERALLRKGFDDAAKSMGYEYPAQQRLK